MPKYFSYSRRNPIPYREVEERVQDWGEVLAKLPNAEHADLLSTQAARCMDCGTPFCHQTATGDCYTLTISTV